MDLNTWNDINCDRMAGWMEKPDAYIVLCLCKCDKNQRCSIKHLHVSCIMFETTSPFVIQAHFSLKNNTTYSTYTCQISLFYYFLATNNSFSTVNGLDLKFSLKLNI